MNVTIQFYTILSMIGMGLYIGAAIDTYHRLLKNRTTYYWLFALNDVLFWFIQACIVFYVLLHVNNGEVRFVMFVALFCGYAAYQALFQRIYQSCLEYLIQKILSIYRMIVRLFVILLINPTKYLLKVAYSLCMMVLSIVLTILHGLWKCIWKVGYLLSIPLFKWTGLRSLFEKWLPFLKRIKGFLLFKKKKD
ncbi:spore cortex biosynthesis protein YabQ [Halalkalibacter hemicellulosilyticus]|nr:spore cortex biosynthesis protein YabQ [Halalkalibacter hemicellulosilyticus]